MLSHRLKGKWSLRRRQGFHSTPYYYLPFAVTPSLCIALHFGIILHSYIVCQRGREFKKGLIFHSQSIRFWRFMPKGEKVLAQSKRTAPPRQFQNFLESYFQLVFFKLVFLKKFYLNWYILKKRFSKIKYLKPS
jgi:hypothetical protein